MIAVNDFSVSGKASLISLTSLVGDLLSSL